MIVLTFSWCDEIQQWKSSLHFGCPLMVAGFLWKNAYCNDPIKSETLVLSVSQKVLLSLAPPKSSSNWPPFNDPPTGTIQSNSATKWRKTYNQLHIWTVKADWWTWWFAVTIVSQALGIRSSHPWAHTMDSWESESLHFASGREVPRRKRKKEASHLLLSCPTRQPRCSGEGDRRE